MSETRVAMNDERRKEFEALWAQLGETLLGHATAQTMRAGEVEPSPTQTLATDRALPGIELVPSARVLGDDAARGVASSPDGDFELREVLGAGGMGKVFLATQRSLGRPVAVKVLHEASKPGARAALVREARMAGSLEHPNIVPVHQLGVDAAANPVLVMKRVEGVSWKELLQDDSHASWTTLPVRHEDALVTHLEVLMKVCNALQFAHAQRVLHRDVKPENVMIGEFGEVYLLDWGISLRLDDDYNDDDTSLTGTPVYMAPEMVTGRRSELGVHSDVYLLGATLHEVLTRRPRHEGPTMAAVMLAAFLSEPYAYGPDVSPELAALCNSATAKDPAKRPATVAAFRQSLADYLEHRASTAMVVSAERALDALEDQPRVGALEHAAITSAQALERMTEARFGYLQALRAWGGNEAARDGLHRALRLMVEREIALKNPTAARGLLADFAEPDAALARRVEALEAEALEAEALAEGARRQQREMDHSIGRKARIAVTLVVLPVVVLGTGYFTRSHARSGHALPLREVLVLDVGVLVTMVCAAVFARRRLFANVLGRRVSLTIMLVAVLATAVDVWGMRFGVRPEDVGAFKLVAMASIFASGGALGIAGMMPVALIGAAGCVLLQVFPAQFDLIMMFAGVSQMVAVVWLVTSTRLRAADGAVVV